MSPNPSFDATKSENLSNVAAKEKALKEEYNDLLKNKEMWTDDFTIHEFFGYSVLAYLYYVVVRAFYYFGLTTDIVVVLTCVLTLYEVTVAKWKIKYSERTLKMRNLTQDGGEMQSKNSKLRNPFWVEEDRGFIHMGDHIDYAVMKYVGDDVPMIVEQEYQHAQLHHETQKQLLQDDEEETKRIMEQIGGLLNGLRKMMLRRTRRFGLQICGMIEASNTYGLLFNVLSGFRPGTLFQFHIFEESEHAAITVQNLKSKTMAIERVIAFPLYCAMLLPTVLFSPLAFFRIVRKEPKCLLEGKTYYQLVEFIWQKIGAYLGSCLAVLLHWVLPVPHPSSVHEAVHTVLEKRVRECGVDWEITKEVTYPLYL